MIAIAIIILSWAWGSSALGLSSIRPEAADGAAREPRAPRGRGGRGRRPPRGRGFSSHAVLAPAPDGKIQAVRECPSPESSVPWPYRTCEQTSDSSFGAQVARFSATDDPFAQFMTTLAKRLENLIGAECSQMVVYGCAFGSKYEGNVNKPFRGGRTRRLREFQGRCFVSFVLEDSAGTRAPVILENRNSKSGLRLLIPVPRSIMPYKSMRRNTKLFKIYGGHMVFAFAKSVVWQDAKLWQNTEVVDYHKLFKGTVTKSGACASFMALPNHRHSVNGVREDGPLFKYHCETILASNRKDVTDDRGVVDKQCKYYQELDAETYSVSLDSGLIDSALILWDMGSDRCRNFNSKLSCTWSNETQCFGDRDQVSFPHALRSMAVREPSPVLPTESMSKDKGFVGGIDTSTPLVHILRGNCHWYYSKALNTCASNLH